ncbi:MAG: biofilm synthesis protein PgaB, partial [Verrucomicrobiaceae bacterium]|nr:biofilm synthesis protein PgaB [Verrucomicrobiaceae bacterium]
LSGRAQVHRFVEAGGGYVGICAGAYLACSGFSWGVHVLNAKTPSPLWERGHADLEIETTKAGQDILGLPAKAAVIYHNGPVLIPGLQKDMPVYEPLVFFRTEVAKTPKQAGLQINTPAMVRSTFGKGRVLVSSPHPEQTPGMEHWLEHAVRAVAGS